MPDRHALLATISDSGQASAAAAVRLHMAMSEKLGLGPADSKVYDVLLRRGPLTAGAIARMTGLTSGAVTTLIDRLETGEFVRRERSEADRRQVFVHAEPAKMAAFAPLMAGYLKGLDALHAGYDEAQLGLLSDYLLRVTALTEMALDDLER